VRRLAFDAHETAEGLRRVWARLRGFPLPPTAAESVGRLRARVPAEGAERRFEGGHIKTVPGIVGDPAAPPKVAPGATTPAAPQQEPGGLDDLLKAKKRVWEERKGEQSDEP
jgi:hypothetical protein